MATTLFGIEIDNTKWITPTPQSQKKPADQTPPGWIHPAITPDFIHVGMLCTKSVGSDSYGSYVCEIHRKGKTLYVGSKDPFIPGITEEEFWKLSDDERWKFNRAKDKQVFDVYTLRRNGRFVLKGMKPTSRFSLCFNRL